MPTCCLSLRAIATLMLALTAFTTSAQRKYDPGVSDTEIKIGQTLPYSGPASSYATFGRSEAAYFRKINDEGGINGRKIVFLSVDDGYSPPKTLEATRRLVEQDQVLLMFGSLGTAQNAAVQGYLNARKVPQLFIFSGAAKWNDPQGHPWTMGLQTSYQTEGRLYGKHVLQTKPNAKIAVLSQNDDFGKDYLKGLKDGLGGRASAMIVAEATYEPTDPTVDSQVIQLQASGADVFMNMTLPKTASQAIRKAYEIGWRPTQYLASISSSVETVLAPAGLDRSFGILTGSGSKDPTDRRWDNDPGMIDWRAFMKKYYPDGDIADINNISGYRAAWLMVHVLRQCGDDLTRENIMRQAANLRNVAVPTNVPGVLINTSPADYAPIKSVQLIRFDGKTWVPMGEVLSP